MSNVENAHGYALDDFDGRVADDEVVCWLESRPHKDAVFDAMHWSRHDLEGRSIQFAWRFVYACVAGCPDAIASMPATRDPDSYPPGCPDCGGPVSRLRRAWDVPMDATPCLYDDD